MGNLNIKGQILKNDAIPQLDSVKKYVTQIQTTLKELNVPKDFSYSSYLKQITQKLSNVNTDIDVVINKVNTAINKADEIERKTSARNEEILAKLKSIDLSMSELSEMNSQKQNYIPYNNTDITTISDREAIEVTKLSNFVNDLEIQFNFNLPKMLSVAQSYKGKKLYEIFNEIDETIKDYTIEEIVSTNSGYSAIVLKRPDGSYLIHSACTNGNSDADCSAIINIFGNYLGDEEFTQTINQIVYPKNNLNSEKNVFRIIDNVATMINETTKTVLYQNTKKNTYNQQIIDNYNLIKKYCENSIKEGTGVHLSGFSLGGGIMASSYGLFSLTEEDLSKAIRSVKLYNPLLASLDNSCNLEILTKINIEYARLFNKDYKIVNKLGKDNKLTIYSAEYDIVSTLNDYVYDLKDRFIFIKADTIPSIKTENEKEFSFQQVIEFFSPLKKGKNLEEYTNLFQNNIKEFADIAIFGKGNHGFVNVEYDEKGNIINKGEYKNINEVFATISGVDYEKKGKIFNIIFDDFITKNDYKPDLSFITELFLKEILPVDEMIDDQNFLGGFLGENYSEDLDLSNIYNYIVKNAGDIEIDELIEVFSKTLYEWVACGSGYDVLKKYLVNMNPMFEQFFSAGSLIDTKKLLRGIMSSLLIILNDEENFETIIAIMLEFAKGNNETAIPILVDSFIKPNLKRIVKDNIDIIIAPFIKEIEKGFEKKIDDFCKNAKEADSIWEYYKNGYKALGLDSVDEIALVCIEDSLEEILEEPDFINNLVNVMLEPNFKYEFIINKILDCMAPYVYEADFSSAKVYKHFWLVQVWPDIRAQYKPYSEVAK